MLKLGQQLSRLAYLSLGLFMLSAPLNSCSQIQAESDEESAVRLGVLVIDSVEATQEEYRPLVDYLQKKTGRFFELVPLNQISQFATVKDNSIDFVASNPLASAQLSRLHDTDLLVTYSRPKTGTNLSGLIITRSNSSINTLEDLKGKTAACVAFLTGAGGCTFQIYHLQKRGIDPFVSFKSFTEIKSQDEIALSVLKGTIDVGFIRTGQLEKMVESGLIDSKQQFKVIDRVNDNFPQEHTTDLYPEWSIAALDETDPQLTEEVKQALLELSGDHPALKAAKLAKFVPAVDYSKFDRLIESLELVSWNVE